MQGINLINANLTTRIYGMRIVPLQWVSLISLINRNQVHHLGKHFRNALLKPDTTNIGYVQK